MYSDKSSGGSTDSLDSHLILLVLILIGQVSPLMAAIVLVLMTMATEVTCI